MKQVTTLCISILLSIISSSAQSYDTTQFYGKNNFLFQHIDKTPISTGLLRDYGIDFQELDNYTGTALHDSNFTSLTDWRMLYGSIYSQQINSTAGLLYLDTLNKLFNQYGIVGQPISFVTLYYNYQSIDPNAQANNQFYMSNNQLYDVSGRSGNPYLSHEVFAVATTRQVATVGDNQFNFRSILYLSNTGKTISTVQVDVLGTGNYQTVNIDNNFTAHYDTAGLYNINIKITYTDNTIRYGHTKLAVYGADYGTAANYKINYHKTFGYKSYGPPYQHEAFEYGNRTPTKENLQADKPYLGLKGEADITVELSINNLTGQIRKPLIVIEGFDSKNAFTYKGKYGLMDRLNYDLNFVGSTAITLNRELDDTNQYDLIFVNYKNGTDYIQRNAYLLEKVIAEVNSRKTTWQNVRQQNVIIGLSMGGLVARYALKDMEDNNVDHETRLFISHDAPHNGANVPVGYQAMLQYIAPWKIINIGFNGSIIPISWVDLVPQVTDAAALLNTPAAKQMLIQRYTLQSSGDPNNFGSISYSLTADNGTHEAFMTDLNSLGWPQNCKNITLANGVCTGTTLFADNAKMLSIDGSQPWDPFTGLVNSFLSTMGGILGLSTGDFLTNGTMPINNTALLAQLPLSLIPSETHLVFDFGAWAVPATGTSQLFRGDVYVQRKLLWLLNSTSYIMKCHVSSTTEMLPIDNAPGGTLDLETFGIKEDDINKELHDKIGKWVDLHQLQKKYCFVPTVSALAFSNPTPYYRTPICNIVNCNTPSAVANFYAPQTSQLHISYTQANADWILQNQDPAFSCAKICASNLSISGVSPICSSEVYTLNGLPSNAAVAWVASPNSVSFSSTTSNPVTVTKTANANVALFATVTNACGGSIETSKNIVVGNPIIQGYYNSPNTTNEPMQPVNRVQSNYNDACYLQYITTNMQVSAGSTVTWQQQGTGSGYVPWTQIGNNIRFYFTEPDDYAFFGITATNNCGSTYIRYKFESANGCVGNLAIKQRLLAATITDNVVSQKLSIFPNPATNSITITLPKDSLNLPTTTITITDISGRKVRQITTVSETNTIPVAAWADGTYIVTVTDGKKKIVKKIVKE